jgi:hypothetical protein
MFAMAVFGRVMLAAAPLHADTIYSFTTIDVPGPFDSEASGIND